MSIKHKVEQLPHSWKPNVMAKELLRLKVREWRELQPRWQAVRPLLNEAKKLEETERALRKEIGEMLGDTLSVVIDSKTLIHSQETRNNGIDYEAAWCEAMKHLSVRNRKKMEKLLVSKTIIIHKLSTE
jgi:hypothetical protein